MTESEYVVKFSIELGLFLAQMHAASVISYR